MARRTILSPGGDGVANLHKYAFNMIGAGTGQAATVSTPNPSVLTPGGFAGLPRIGMGTGTDTGKLQLTYIRRKGTGSGLTYAVQFSDTLATGSWAVNTSAVESVTSIDSTFERVSVTVTAVSKGKRFARVSVTPN